MSSIFESLLRNSISIFGFGGISDPRHGTQAKKVIRKVIKKPAPQGIDEQQGVPAAKYENVKGEEDDGIEMTNY